MASELVAWATDGWSVAPPWRVLDPAVGAGAFLLAAADHQVGRGAPAGAVMAGLAGVDIDPGGVAAATAALQAWAAAHRAGADARATVTLGDGLDLPGPDGGSGFDLVVGNPPFLGQLARATARDSTSRDALRARFGPAATGYVDTAALFLLVGLDAVRPGGRVLLVQPESVLGTAHTGALRARVEARAEVLGLRVLDRRAFAAHVDTCALLLERRDVPPSDPPRGAAVSWSPWLARDLGVPVVELDPGAGTVGDRATTTAGFRQHHYGLAAHVEEHRGGLDPVVTTGMVDPGTLGWGERSARIGGRRWDRPAVDLDAVAAEDPAVGRWFRARRVPKVLVAPQTRVVEAAVDPDGRYLPATPLVSVEPRLGLGDDAELAPWLLLAALSAPPITAWAMARSAGTARGRQALKLTAGQAGEVPLPAGVAQWRAAAEDLRSGATVTDVAAVLTRAHGLAADHPVLAWWRGRLG